MLTKEEILKVAKLARLVVNSEELDGLTKDFNSILSYINQLEKVDVNGVEAMSHVHGITNIFREDKIEDSLSPEAGLANAPDRSGNFFRVPLVIETED